ncbi:MAG: (2Fe-2S)-binding protein [Rhodomicrobium sp.]|nr:(2Fe-2S)-binding protein [Rhodomicrobium sp.]
MARARINPPRTSLPAGGTRALIGVHGEVVCYCNDLYAADVEKEIRANGFTRVEEITAQTHKDTPCALCSKRISALLERINGTGIPAAALSVANGAAPTPAIQPM